MDSDSVATMFLFVVICTTECFITKWTQNVQGVDVPLKLAQTRPKKEFVSAELFY